MKGPPKTNRYVVLLGAIFVFVNIALVSIPISWSDAFICKHGDAMDWRSWWLAGSHSINCGRVRVGQDPTQATKCALEASNAGRPFRVRYDIRGVDSAVAAGLVKTLGGHLYALSFDGNPMGGGRTSLWGQVVCVKSCPEPERLYVNPTGRLNCFQAALSYPRGIMSCRAVLSRVSSGKNGYLFSTRSGRPLGQRNITRTLYTLSATGGFHAFRRFRTSVLRKSQVPEDLIHLWLGHSGSTITDAYARQLREDIPFRQEWGEKAGLGFKLVSKSGQLGHLGLPFASNVEVEVAA